MLEAVQAILPPQLKRMIELLSPEIKARLEEIRIRQHKPLEICSQQTYFFVTANAELTSHEKKAYCPTVDDCRLLLELLTHHSIYSFEEELKRGFITIRGGHRIGLAGRTVLEKSEVKFIRDVGSFNIRIAREMHDVGQQILPKLHNIEQDRIYSTLIVSLPQQGKTTLLRDLARIMSQGKGLLHSHAYPVIQRGFKVGIVDERSEIAACVKGVPSFDVGSRTDVMDACPKAEGIMMLIRSMSPEVIIVDEIGKAEDARAIREALFAGISVIASAHGAHFDDVCKRPALNELFKEQSFERFIFIKRNQNSQVYYHIFSADGKRILDEPLIRMQRG
jgi:stage III sporulation protein AA